MQVVSETLKKELQSRGYSVEKRWETLTEGKQLDLLEVHVDIYKCHLRIIDGKIFQEFHEIQRPDGTIPPKRTAVIWDLNDPSGLSELLKQFPDLDVRRCH